MENNKINPEYLGLTDDEFTAKVVSEINKVETTKSNVLQVAQEITGLSGFFDEEQEETFILINPGTGHKIEFEMD